MAFWRSRRFNNITRIVLIALALTLAGAQWLLTKATTPSSDSKPLISTSSSPLPAGWPKVVQHDVNHAIQFLHNNCYDVGYSNERGNPIWVAYRVTAKQDGQVDKRQDKFLTDERTSAKIVHEHYTRSGYDRGHLAPNHAIATMCDDEAQKETFLLSNISPQSKALNQRWWERLERAELNFFTHIFQEVWVIDGPVFGANPVHLANGPVQVPDAFYKIFLAHKGDQWHSLAFLVDQGVKGDEALSQFRVSVQDVEQRIGIDLLPNMPEPTKATLKKDRSDPIWSLADVDHLPTRF